MIFQDIPTLYINLDKRIDRKIHVENELKELGMKHVERFKAISLSNGALGCSMSHLKCIELAKKNEWQYVFVCEDDIQFLDRNMFLQNFTKFVESNVKWDMILVAGNNMIPYIPINDICIKVMNCQTTTGYVVKKEYYDTLINNYKSGIEKLIREPENNMYKIDKYWFSLQRIHNWYLIIPLSVIQKEDYSDIECKNVNFKNYMLNYNKAYKPKS